MYYLCTDVRVQCALDSRAHTVWTDYHRDDSLCRRCAHALCAVCALVLAADGAAKDDFWILESATLEWTEQTRADVKGSWPAMRHSMAFVPVNSDTIIVFGGKSAGEWPLRVVGA